MRPFDPQNEKLVIKEGEAIAAILDNKVDKYEIITSLFGIKQFDKMLEHETDTNKISAINSGKRSCVFYADRTIRSIPAMAIWEEFMQKSEINHDEDGWHIILAWVDGVDCFITGDWELHNTRKNRIESVLGSIYPPPGVTTKNMEILDPITFVNNHLT